MIDATARAPHEGLPRRGGGSRRLFEIAGGNHDLDMRGHETASLHPIRRDADNPPHRRGGCFGPSLREPQKGEARLRLPSPPARALVAFLGLCELSSETMELSLLVKGGRGHAGIGGLDESFRRLARFFDRG